MEKAIGRGALKGRKITVKRADLSTNPFTY
jgi:hypothetical protein